MQFIYNDGGRSAAGYKGQVRDCVCRAITIATERPYEEIYHALEQCASYERIGKKRRSSPRTGVHRESYERLLGAFGWKWISTMKIGSGCKVHLRDGELPMGKLIVRCSKHLVAVIDGVIHDTKDPQRNGKRCVYGYFTRK